MMYLGSGPGGEKVLLPPTDFLTHGVVLGRTGSGKSGLTIALLEEVAKSGASALVLDPKGDLTNLALSLSTEPEFANWVEDFPDEVRLKHGHGLAQSDLSFRDVEEWRDHVNVTIYAPGKISGGGKSVNLFPTFNVPARAFNKTAVSREVATVLASIDGSDNPYDPALIFLTEAVLDSWSRGQPLPVTAWPGVLGNPSEALKSFGGMKLNDFFPKAQRTKLARKLIGFHHQADRWLSGAKLDLHAMTGRQKPEIAVFSMRHLSEEDRQFFAALLLSKVVEFMFETDASEHLKLLCVLDEARGYLPPHPYNPPTKGPICTILAQGRAQGIGMLIGTQNPMDLDYKALSNVGTWFVGRLRQRDCARDLLTELSSRGIEPEDVADVPQRSFLLLDKRGGHDRFQTRWCLNYLFGPMSGDQLSRLQPSIIDKVRERFPDTPRATPAPEIKVFKPKPEERPKAVVLPPQELVEVPRARVVVEERVVAAPSPEPSTLSRAMHCAGMCVAGFLMALGAFVLLCVYLENTLK
jgi:hypothetical protein